jgi:hypothetical protein
MINNPCKQARSKMSGRLDFAKKSEKKVSIFKQAENRQKSMLRNPKGYV